MDMRYELHCLAHPLVDSPGSTRDRRFGDEIAARHGAPGRRPSGAAERNEHLSRVPDPACWERARAALTAAILTSATPGRDDRLFPGNIEGIPAGGLSIAHGAAGVLYALDVTGAGRYPEYEAWLARQALSPPDDARLGFYDGLHGVAYVLEHLCRRDEALKIIDGCMGPGWERLGLDLAGGLTGIALNLRHFGRRLGEPSLYDAAVQVADIVADRLGEDGEASESDQAADDGADRRPTGLFGGPSGPALLFIRMFEDTGDQVWLDRAADALRQDLRRCTDSVTGNGDVPGDVHGDIHGDIHGGGYGLLVPSLSGGGVGIAIVIDEYLAHRVDEGFSAAGAAIRDGAAVASMTRPGLFNGRAGLLAYLAGRYQPDRARADADVALHVWNLAWQAQWYQGHLLTPDDRSNRLSVDLATGAAGVLLALGAAMHDDPVSLPLLEQGPRADFGQT